MVLTVPDCKPFDDQSGEPDIEVGIGNLSCIQQLPESGHVLAPWVAIKFMGSGSVITVSNDSSPSTDPQNVAVIKSFEYGYTDGMNLRVTIQDQQGGSFVTFMDHMVNHFACLEGGHPGSLLMEFQWGWVKSGCKSPIPNAKSDCHYALVISVETSFSGGKFTTELTGKDAGFTMLEGGSERIIGGTGEETVCLTDAIRQLLISSESPNVTSVKFLRMKGGKPIPCPFEYGCQKGDKTDEENKLLGPPGTWRANSQDKLRSVLRWLNEWRTDDLKGFYPQFNSLVKGGEIIFWEDRKPKCNCKGNKYWEENCIGRYLVNGGKKSPVIEFNPSIRWDFSRLTSVGGTISNETTSPFPPTKDDPGGSKSPGRRECISIARAANRGAGHPLMTQATENPKELVGEEAVDLAQKGNDEQFRALRVDTDPITADLVIVGSPTILPPSEARQRNVYIKFVNPYHLMDGKGCTDWLAKPKLNEVLTNKAWVVNSVTHKIESGNYTTILKIFLATPGLDGNAGEPIGLWCHGWRPSPCT